MLKHLSTLRPWMGLLFSVVMLVKGVMHSVFFEDYHNALLVDYQEISFLKSAFSFYLMFFMPFIEAALGLLLLLRLWGKWPLYAIFIFYIFATYFYLDSWKLELLSLHFALAYAGLWLTGGKYFVLSDLSNMVNENLPTGSMENG